LLQDYFAAVAHWLKFKILQLYKLCLPCPSHIRSIKRIIFNSLVKPNINEKGEKELNTISTSQALQIAGRAGRFSSIFKEGEVTTMHRDDLPILKEILSRTVHAIEVRNMDRF
jgi:hypothetical protein